MAIGVPYLVGATATPSTAPSTTATATLTAGVPLGDSVLVIVVHGGFSASAAFPTDSKGNSYSGAGALVSSADQLNERFAIAPVTAALVAGDTVSVSLPGSTGYAMQVYGVAGITAFDVGADSTEAFGGSATVTLTGPTTQADELLIGMRSMRGNATAGLAAGSGYTLLTTTASGDPTAGLNYGMTTEYQIVAATGTYTAAITATTSSTRRMAIRTFKGGVSVTIPVATESETAPAPVARVDASRTLTVATEAEAALPPTLTRTASVTPPVATESETALAPTLTRTASGTPPVATETETAFAPTVTISVSAAIPVATEGETAYPAIANTGVSATLPVPRVTEAEVAFGPTLTRTATGTVSRATESEVAYPPTVATVLTVLVPVATEVETAYPAMVAISATVYAPVATEAETAYPPSWSVLIPQGVGAATRTLVPPSVRVYRQDAGSVAALRWPSGTPTGRRETG